MLVRLLDKANGLMLLQQLKRQFKPVALFLHNYVFEYEEGVRTFIGDINFDRQLTIEPGEEKNVTVRFPSCLQIERYLNIGRTWWIHEGSR